MKKIFSRMVAIISVMVLCLSLGGCWLFAEQGTAPDYPDSMANVDTIVFDTIETGNREKLDRIDAVAQVERSVVAIKIEYTVSGKNASSSGSGVIVNIENAPQNCFYIITCHHIIDSMGLITVYVPDMECRNFNDADYDERFAFTGTISNQKNNNDEIILVGGDKDYDIAVLMLNLNNVSDVSASEIQAAKVAPQDENVYQVRRGEDVFSVGNPGGDLPMTVSSGIISYLDREVAIGGVGYMTLMQIDVQTNPGNSGGGLFNLYGELIGITNAGNTNMDGINYAIPYVMSYDTSEKMGFINTAKQLIATYTAFRGENYGYVERHWALGISIAEHKNAITENVEYVYVARVVSSGDAEKAGIAAGDIIISIENNSINSATALSKVIYSLKKTHTMGDSLVIRVKTGNSYANRTLTLSQNIFCDTGYVLPVAA